MQPIVGIYKITSPTNRIYIGQSTNINRRESEYKSGNGSVKSQVLLYRSINKYGWKNHTFEIIEECKFEDLNKRERYWQDYYDVLGPNGLNCVLVDSESKPKEFSKETRDKIKQKAIGRVHTKKTKLKMSESRRGAKHYNWNKNLSKETKLKISEANKNKVRSEDTKLKISVAKKGIVASEITKQRMSESNKRATARKIDKLDLDGNYIETFNSLKEAAESCGGKSSHISCVANGKRNSTLGFKWRYNND